VDVENWHIGVKTTVLTLLLTWRGNSL